MYCTICILSDCNFRSWNKVYRKSTDKNKYINLILEISIDSIKTIVDYQTKNLQSIY